MKTLNELYSPLSAGRRYEVWFIRLGLADGSGAWWFRYLLMNPGRGGCPDDPRGMPVQVWATWFPRDGKPQSFIQGFPLDGLDLSTRRQNPFHFRVGNNEIGEGSCRGALQVEGRTISWDLRYRSTFRFTMSNKGWIGFSRTPQSDAVFSGQITMDGRSGEGNPLGFGVQGHNCGYRHRNFWTWTHAYFAAPKQIRRHSKHWSTKCHSDWSFAKPCSGMVEKSTRSGICNRSEEIRMGRVGVFAVPRRMDSGWRQRLMALGRAFIVFLT